MVTTMNIFWFRVLCVCLGAAMAAAGPLFPAYTTYLVGLGGLVTGLGTKAEMVHGGLGAALKAMFVKSVAGLMLVLALCAYACSDLHVLDPKDVKVDCDNYVRSLDDDRAAGLSCEEARLHAVTQFPRCEIHPVICAVRDAGEEEASDVGSDH